ncbi:Subtilisin-like protein protease [Heracleum sosnowskyi]|uniref:Subtilisin-like protein protease n=1 Tax=Heracleum sosnowskyi TaxID=360622 RepID=A0AAD8LX63_9APIA|nr:Subtilisin-like protein protease [Heracleum sosnowskyi]
MILANNDLSENEIVADLHVLPVSHITYSDGLAVSQYINLTKSPVAYITRPTTQLGTKPAPLMAVFSSAGPNPITPEILKPDISAPGVSIIAAYRPEDQLFDKHQVVFNAMSGTSMSCPHVSGIAGLLKSLHPTWSPAAIKSAMMTTARTQDNTIHAMTNTSHLKATPLSYGAGHVEPNRAMDSGLVYDLTVDDYLTFLCSLNYNQSQITLFAEEPYSCPKQISLTDFNYPSITIPNLNGSITVTRKVKNVGSPGTYKARVVRPPGITVSVEPNSLQFDKIGEEKSFKLKLKLKQRSAAKEYVSGKLIWCEESHCGQGNLKFKEVLMFISSSFVVAS